jgi:hypothetical protein
MKIELLLKVTRVITGIVLAITIATSFGFEQQSSAREEKGRKNYYARIREGVGTEVQFAAADASPEQVRTSVESLVRFIQRRSGLRITSEVREQLVSLEAAAIAGESPLIQFDELIKALSIVGMERLSNLSDQEIDLVVETLRGFDSQDLPELLKMGRDTIRISGNALIDISPEDFRERLIAFRDKNAQRRAKDAVRAYFQQSLLERLSLLSTALPDQFGQNYDRNKKWAGKALTPVQAFLLTYSIVADDPLLDSTTNLLARMNRLRDSIRKKIGHYPDTDGYFAYGTNGYIYSFPLDIVFDSQTQASLLLSFAKEGN